jgi:hypothetical protein
MPVTTGGVAAAGKSGVWRGGGSGSGGVLIFGTLRRDARRQQRFSSCFNQAGRDVPIAPRLARGASPTIRIQSCSRKPEWFCYFEPASGACPVRRSAA